MNGKNILLCVTGGIAVYKAVALTSKLTQKGANVKVMMTENAKKFVTPLSFQAISRNDVYFDTFDEKDSEKIAHIDLADWPDMIIIAPATANIIGKLANGIADDMISTTLLATKKPVFIAPAMNVHMYAHPIVQANMQRLREIGCQFIEPNEGYLACGYVGKGRLAEPEFIAEVAESYLSTTQSTNILLQGKNVVITAGPTRERIDPVRYLSNFSSGKMGYAMAEAARDLGANVTLISGPVAIEKPKGIRVINIESAEEMYQAVMAEFHCADIIVKTAAVADYKPKLAVQEKIKKQADTMTLELVKTTDILAEIGKQKTTQTIIGFAAETQNVDFYAKKKLAEKNADFIVANNVASEGIGFGSDMNIVTIYPRGGDPINLPKLTKREVAEEILKIVVQNETKEDYYESR